jgi:hypothetical protein
MCDQTAVESRQRSGNGTRRIEPPGARAAFARPSDILRVTVGGGAHGQSELGRGERRQPSPSPSSSPSFAPSPNLEIPSPLPSVDQRTTVAVAERPRTARGLRYRVPATSSGAKVGKGMVRRAVSRERSRVRRRKLIAEYLASAAPSFLQARWFLSREPDEEPDPRYFSPRHLAPTGMVVHRFGTGLNERIELTPVDADNAQLLFFPQADGCEGCIWCVPISFTIRYLTEVIC